MENISVVAPVEDASALRAVPAYLQTHYWWAYIHPRAIRFFERQWLVNLILWGNYSRLCDEVLQGFEHRLPGRTLQIACAYGDLTPRLAACVDDGGVLEVVDVLQEQLDNLSAKLPEGAPVRMRQMDSSALETADASVDRALLFFLLHEQPAQVRAKTVAEALRVVRPGGTLTIVDYSPPARWNPLRYLWTPVLRVLEPFADDLFRHPIRHFLPTDEGLELRVEKSFFGGLFQMVTVELPSVPRAAG